MVHICLFFIKFMTYFDKYRLTFYVKQRQKGQPLGAAFFVCQNRFSYILFSSVELYFVNL